MKSEKQQVIEKMLKDTGEFPDETIEDSAGFVVGYVDACMSVFEEMKKLTYEDLYKALGIKVQEKMTDEK